jgi:trans-aconitate methyltransferase
MFSLISLVRLAINLFSRSITFRQFLLELKFRFTSKTRIQNDDFDWTSYHRYYREELKSIGRKHTLILKKDAFAFENGELSVPGLLPLHPNHKLLYETILRINPISIIEVGCGGGDHLANLQALNPEFNVFGVDRSVNQLDHAVVRHPALENKMVVLDITSRDLNLEQADLVFSQAVLMHISETENRFQIAFSNMFALAKAQIVLVENWTQHDFLDEAKRNISENQNWSNAKIYCINSQNEKFVSAMVISKYKISGLDELAEYTELLEGRDLIVH